MANPFLDTLADLPGGQGSLLGLVSGLGRTFGGQDSRTRAMAAVQARAREAIAGGQDPRIAVGRAIMMDEGGAFSSLDPQDITSLITTAGAAAGPEKNLTPINTEQGVASFDPTTGATQMVMPMQPRPDITVENGQVITTGFDEANKPYYSILGDVGPEMDFKVVGNSLVKINTRDGSAQVVMDRTQATQPTDLQTKLGLLIGQGTDPNLAVDLALGNVVVVQSPDTGQPFLVNRRTGVSKPLSPEEVGPLQGVIDSVGAPTVPEGAAGLGAQPVEDLVAQSVGIVPNVASALSGTIGQFTEEPIAPETMSARGNMTAFVQLAKTAFINNPRFPVAEQEKIANFLPSTEVFKDPRMAVQDLKNLRATLAQLRASRVQTSRNPRTSVDARKDALEGIETIDRVLGLMGPEQSTTTTAPPPTGDAAAPVYPTADAIAYLKAHPDTAEWFDLTYGKGMAKQYLGAP